MKLPTAATTSRDSDDDKVQEVDEPILSAPVPNRDSDKYMKLMNQSDNYHQRE